METLNDCFEHQVEFNKMVMGHKGLDAHDLTREQLSDWSMYFIHCMHTELSEVMGENQANLDWKRHREPTGNYRPAEAIKELVDLQKYLWNLFAMWGIRTPEELVAAFSGKTAEVLNRWATEEVPKS